MIARTRFAFNERAWCSGSRTSAKSSRNASKKPREKSWCNARYNAGKTKDTNCVLHTPGQGMAEACSTKLVVKRKREKTYAAGVYVTDQQHNSREALRNAESNHEIAGFPKVQLWDGERRSAKGVTYYIADELIKWFINGSIANRDD